MILQRKKHKIMVEIILPKKHLSLPCIGCKAHITRQTVTIDFHITTISTLESYTSFFTVYYAESSQLTHVASIGIVKQSMLQGNGRSIRCFVDDAYGLTIGDIPATVSLWFFNSKVIELCITAIPTFYIIHKKSMTRPLESNELIREGHHASKCLKCFTISRVSILCLIIIIFTDTTEIDFSINQIDGHHNSIIIQLLKTTEGSTITILNNAYPRARNVNVT